ncbi:MAG: DUF4209 domain-containing protein [Anaerolineae bacterium]|nr:DUF4209 domain-containing protein [Anaerolineae bacterium]
MNINEIAGLLERSAQKANDWNEISKSLRNHGIDTPDHVLWKYVYAFDYMYVEDSMEDYIEQYGPFAPIIEMKGKVYPPPLNAISEVYLDEWKEIIPELKHPILCSRLADLLWVRKWGDRPDLFAAQAIDAYSELSKSAWEEINRAFCLIRALDLCKEIKDNNRQVLITNLIIDACKRELKSETAKPSVALRLIGALFKLPKKEIPDEVDNLLEVALQVYVENPWIAENIFDLMLKRADGNKQIELKKNQINRWIEEAEKSKNGFLRLSHLEHALELARNYGLSDIANELRITIQSIPEDDLELKTILAKVEIPNERIEAYINWFVGEESWKEAFVRLGHNPPPSGNYSENIEVIKKQSQEIPLQFLVTNVIFDDNNIPLRIGRSLDENMEIALVRQETIGIQVFSTFAPKILERIKEKHGIPPLPDLTEFFTTEIIPSDIAEHLSKAIHWYFNEEYDVSAHILVPIIEAIIRIVARDIGFPIFREPVGTNPGRVEQLGSLLERLRDLMDDSLRRFLYNVLSNPIGLNLRNRICHGLLIGVGKEDAALLIQVVCYLRQLKIYQPENENPVN